MTIKITDISGGTTTYTGATAFDISGAVVSFSIPLDGGGTKTVKWNWAQIRNIEITS